MAARAESGFTLIEIILVVVLIALVSTLVIPLSIDYLQRQSEKKQILDLTTRISALKKQAVARLQLGEIRAEEDALVLLLDHKEVERFPTSGRVRLKRPITFNRNGITNGGEIRLRLSHHYTIRVEEISGKISLQRGE